MRMYWSFPRLPTQNYCLVISKGAKRILMPHGRPWTTQMLSRIPSTAHTIVSLLTITKYVRLVTLRLLRRLSRCRIEQVNAEYAPYYRNSLLYLACVDLEKDMSQDERLLRAHDLAVSAFLAETIYNFGELVCRSADCEPRTTLIFAAFLMCGGLVLRS